MWNFDLHAVKFDTELLIVHVPHTPMLGLISIPIYTLFTYMYPWDSIHALMHHAFDLLDLVNSWYSCYSNALLIKLLLLCISISHTCM